VKNRVNLPLGVGRAKGRGVVTVGSLGADFLERFPGGVKEKKKNQGKNRLGKNMETREKHRHHMCRVAGGNVERAAEGGEGGGTKVVARA